MFFSEWFFEGLALAGEYLSGAWLLGICGAIAFWGFDGFLYAIGMMAGWVAGLLLVGGRMRKLGVGRVSVGGILGRRFDARGVKMAGMVSAVVVGILFLMVEMAGAGAVMKILGVRYEWGVMGAGVVVVLNAWMAGEGARLRGVVVKGGMLILVSAFVVVLVLRRGVEVRGVLPRRLSTAEFREQLAATDKVLANTGEWAGLHFARVEHADGGVSVWKYVGMERLELLWPAGVFSECELVTVTADGRRLVNGKAEGVGNELRGMGFVRRLAKGGNGTGAVGPLVFLAAMQASDIGLVKREVVRDERGVNTVYFSEATSGGDVLSVGNSEMFAGVRSGEMGGRMNFLSLMLAMFFGVAAVPGVLGRYCGMGDGRTARGMVVTGGIGVGLFCGMTLLLGLGAMICGRLDAGDSNMGLLMLARSFGGGVLAVVWVVLMGAIVGTGTGVVREIRRGVGGSMVMGVVAVGVAVGLGILVEGENVAVLMGLVFGVAVSGNLAAVVMSLFWKGSTGAGVVASIVAGFGVALVWIGLGRAGMVGFEQPALVGVPVGFLVLVGVSLVTRGRGDLARG